MYTPLFGMPRTLGLALSGNERKGGGAVGADVGASVGTAVGAAVGEIVGTAVGAAGDQWSVPVPVQMFGFHWLDVACS